MKVIELVKKMRVEGAIEKFLSKELPNIEFDMIDSFMIDSIDIQSEISFFNIEELPDGIEMKIGEILYVNFFPLYLIKELIEDFLNLYGISSTDLHIAEKLIEYRINDA
jgi:hypothetical protein